MGPADALVVVPTVRPPSVSVTLFEAPVAPLIQITAHAVPLTVVPLVGCVTKICSVPVGGGGCAGGEVRLRTVTSPPPAPVLPLAPRTEAVRVCAPSVASRVSYGSAIGPGVALVVVPTVRPPSVSVTAFEAPAAPLIQITAQGIPLTLVPSVGWVIATCSVPVGGGGGGGAG